MAGSGSCREEATTLCPIAAQTSCRTQFQLMRHEQRCQKAVKGRTHFLPASDIDDRFRVIFDAVNDGIFISNPSTGRFIEVNQPGCHMFGYDKAELIGRDIEALSSGVHPYNQDIAIERLRKASIGQPQVFEWQCQEKEQSIVLG